MYNLMKSIEIVTRRHLHQSVTVSSCPIRELILNDALKSEEILQNWEIVANFPVKYEAYSVELLKAVVTLWTTVRCFAFAKRWNEQFQRKFKKHGTRSTLKRKGTEKETE